MLHQYSACIFFFLFLIDIGYEYIVVLIIIIIIKLYFRLHPIYTHIQIQHGKIYTVVSKISIKSINNYTIFMVISQHVQ